MDSFFGASDAAQHAAAVINGDVPDTDLFGDKESDDEDAFGQSSTRFRGDAEVDDPFGVAPPVSVSAAGESDAFAEPLGVAEVAKKARTRRPKLDANVLCGEQHGLGALYARSKELTREEKTLSDRSGDELKSLRKIMNEYRAFSQDTFGSLNPAAFYEKCEKLGGGAQIRSLMEVMRYRSVRPDDKDSEDDDWGSSTAADGGNVGGQEQQQGVFGMANDSSSSSSSNAGTPNDGISKMTDEELRARIARNRAAALERLAQRNAEKERQAQEDAMFTLRLAGSGGASTSVGDDFMDDDDDFDYGAIDMVAIEKQAAEKRQSQSQQESAKSADMMELSDDEDDLEIEPVQKLRKDDESQDVSQLRYEESQEFESQGVQEAP